jgi:hypothetical protein
MGLSNISLRGIARVTDGLRVSGQVALSVSLGVLSFGRALSKGAP